MDTSPSSASSPDLSKNIPEPEAEVKEPSVESSVTPKNPKGSRGGKFVIGLCLFVGIIAIVGVLVAYFFEPYSEPQNIRVTNVTSRSVSVSWTTKESTKGIVLYSQEDDFLPFILAKFGKEAAHDDRDVAEKRLEVVEEAAQEGADAAADSTLLSEVVVDDNSYYTHHITITNLEPSKTYYFRVGNSIRFSNSADAVVNDEFSAASGFSFSTAPEQDDILVPHPAYGLVVEEGDIDGERAIDDGVFYMVVVQDDGSEVSMPLSSQLNENGRWYIDLSGARGKDGGIIEDLDEDVDTERVYAVTGTSGESDVVNISMALDAPMIPIEVSGVSSDVESRNPLISFVYGNYSECRPYSFCTERGKYPIRNTDGARCCGANYTESDEYIDCGYMEYCCTEGDEEEESGQPDQPAEGEETGEDWGPCSGGQGHCQNNEEGNKNCVLDGAAGEYQTGLCPGPTNIQCCIPYEQQGGGEQSDEGEEPGLSQEDPCEGKQNGETPNGPEWAEAICCLGVPMTGVNFCDSEPESSGDESQGDGGAGERTHLPCGTRCTDPDGCTCGSGEIPNCGGYHEVDYMHVCPFFDPIEFSDSACYSGQDQKLGVRSCGSQCDDSDGCACFRDNGIPCSGFLGGAAAVLNSLAVCGDTCPTEAYPIPVPLGNGKTFPPSSQSEKVVGMSREGIVSAVLADEATYSISDDYIFTPDEDGVYSVSIAGIGVLENAILTAGESYQFFLDENGNGVQDVGEEMIDLSENAVDVVVNDDLSVFSMKFSKGYNFVSFSFLPEQMDSCGMIVDLNDSTTDRMYVTQIARFSSGAFDVTSFRSDIEDSVSGECFPIVPGRGYVFRTETDIDVNIGGYALVNPAPVRFSGSGWFLIGVNGGSEDYTGISLLETVSAVGGLSADNVTRWDVSSSRYDGVQVEGETVYGHDFLIEDKLGYFVRITEGSGTWVPE